MLIIYIIDVVMSYILDIDCMISVICISVLRPTLVYLLRWLISWNSNFD